MPLTCITCGSSMPDDADFCPSCGRVVVRETAGEPEPAQTASLPPLSATESYPGTKSEPGIDHRAIAHTAIPEADLAHANTGQPPARPDESTRSANPPEVKSPVEAQETVPLPPPVLSPSIPRAMPNRPAPTRSPRPTAPAVKSQAPRTQSAGKAQETSATGSQATLNDRWLAAAAYLTFLPAVVFLLIRQYQRRSFIRFHAWQSIFFWILIAVLAGLGVLASTFGFLLVWLVTGILVVVAIFLTWLVLEIKALQGEWFHLPGVGTLAGHFGNA